MPYGIDPYFPFITPISSQIKSCIHCTVCSRLSIVSSSAAIRFFSSSTVSQASHIDGPLSWFMCSISNSKNFLFVSLVFSLSPVILLKIISSASFPDYFRYRSYVSLHASNTCPVFLCDFRIHVFCYVHQAFWIFLDQFHSMDAVFISRYVIPMPKRFNSRLIFFSYISRSSRNFINLFMVYWEILDITLCVWHSSTFGNNLDAFLLPLLYQKYLGLTGVNATNNKKWWKILIKFFTMTVHYLAQQCIILSWSNNFLLK